MKRGRLGLDPFPGQSTQQCVEVIDGEREVAGAGAALCEPGVRRQFKYGASILTGDAEVVEHHGVQSQAADHLQAEPAIEGQGGFDVGDLDVGVMYAHQLAASAFVSVSMS